MEKFKLPKKWCIRQNTDQIVCDWFNKKFDLNSALNGNFKYINSDGWYWDESQYVKYGDYTEITFEQFLEHVLKQTIQKPKYNRLLFILQFINNYGIKRNG